MLNGLQKDQFQLEKESRVMAQALEISNKDLNDRLSPNRDRQAEGGSNFQTLNTEKTPAKSSGTKQLLEELKQQEM